MWKKGLICILVGSCVTGSVASPLPPIAPKNNGAPLVDVFVASDGCIIAAYEGDHNDVVVASDTVKRRSLTGLLSPSRDRYFLVEVTSPIVVSSIDYERPPYVTEQDFPEWPEAVPPLGHEGVVYQIQIYSLEGGLEQSIPIERVYSAWYSRGIWLNHRWIALQRIGRRAVMQTLLVDIERPSKFLLSGVEAIAGSRDGKHIVWWERGMLFLDFVGAFPVYGDEPVNLGDRESWERYRQRHYVTRKPFYWQREQVEEHRVESFFLSPPSNAQVILMDKHPRGTRPPQLVWIDIGRFASAKKLQDYSRIEVLPNDQEAVLERDDKKREIRVRGRHGEMLWRRTFDELAKP